MEWSVILTSVVVAALITAIMNVIKSMLDNRAKTRDSVQLFRYTKLHEILTDWQLKNYAIEPDASGAAELKRNQNLQHCYAQARPLVSKKYWRDIDERFSDMSSLKVELIKSSDRDIMRHLLERNGRLEAQFVEAVQLQMEELLRT